MAQQNATGARVVLNQLLNLQTDIEPWALPWDIDNVVAIDLPRQLFLIDRSGNCDYRIRMQMIDVLERNEGMQRRINRTRTRIQIKDTMAVHRVHNVFDGQLWSAFRTVEVAGLHRAHLVEIKRREAI